MEHVDKQVTPWIKKIMGLDEDINGNGKDGIKTKTAVMAKEQEIFQLSVNKSLRALEDKMEKRLSEIEKKQDRATWFALVTTVGIVVTIILKG